MNHKCSHCRLVNFPDALTCARCGVDLSEGNAAIVPKESAILKRALICVGVCIAVIIGFYVSLIASSRPLSTPQGIMVRSAIRHLKEKGFGDDAMLLEKLTVFRSDDNWLNASVAKENAFAATNFPFEIVTLYPDFFIFPDDDIERAAILLHEARHLRGEDERDAYEFVWKNRNKLGWTKDEYYLSVTWQNIRKQTRENAPHLFACIANDFGDCTQ